MLGVPSFGRDKFDRDTRLRGSAGTWFSSSSSLARIWSGHAGLPSVVDRPPVRISECRAGNLERAWRVVLARPARDIPSSPASTISRNDCDGVKCRPMSRHPGASRRSFRLSAAWQRLAFQRPERARISPQRNTDHAAVPATKARDSRCGDSRRRIANGGAAGRQILLARKIARSAEATRRISGRAISVICRQRRRDRCYSLSALPDSLVVKLTLLANGFGFAHFVDA